MNATIEELADIPSAERSLSCYSGLYSAAGLVFEPESEEHVRRVYAYAAAAGRKVTCRGGGHAFDGQSLGDDLVISMARLNAIEVFADERRLRVGAGARWGTIVAALEPHGLVPRVTVTTAEATAGGTLASDCLSRFSPAWGKEGEAIESFRLITPAGETITATPPVRNAEPSTWTREQRTFCGVIGGLGYLGAVIEITYHRLLRASKAGGRIAVRTQVHKFDTFDDLAKRLLPRTRRMREEADAGDPEKLDAVWCALNTRGKGDRSVLWFTSALETTTERRPMLLHRPRLLIRVPVEWLMRVSWISKLMWPIFFRLYGEGSVYHDDLEGYTFFMDGNVRAKRIGQKLRFKMRNIQQTFIVPLDPYPAANERGPEEQLVAWLEHANELLLERKLTPTMNDALFLPPDHPFALSASYGLAGFAVSYAFETSNPRTLERARAAFTDLSDDLWNQFGGRVHLVKNVCARRETLWAMYGDHAGEFFRLKRELDPDRVLDNDFLERNFGASPEAAGPAAA
jgi:decaprenylphospho-beta-D-ribofuranose 2-oxidase